MPAPLLLLAALGAAQALTPAPAAGHGRAFISPMGEPFHDAGDGLTTWFRQADRNHDGFLTMDELRQDAQRFFLVLDANHDGEIDPDEVDHYETVLAPEIRSSSASFSGDSTNDEATGGGRLGLLTIPEPVTAADTNLDRGVSSAEFQTAAEKRFRLLDRDGDGRLGMPELQAMRSAVRNNARRARNPAQSDPDIDNGLPPIGGDSMPQAQGQSQSPL
jgi:Ca2+-binding EF-hand superfamily protein